MAKTKDGRDQNTFEYRNRTFHQREEHAATFRFDDLDLESLEQRIEDMVEAVTFYQEKVEVVWRMNELEPEKEALFTEAQCQLRMEQARLRMAEKAMRRLLACNQENKLLP